MFEKNIAFLINLRSLNNVKQSVLWYFY